MCAAASGRQRNGLMTRVWIVLGVIALAIWLFNRDLRRRARRAQDRWHCTGCGAYLPADLPRAAGDAAAAAGLCRACRAREARVRWLAWVGLPIAFVVTLVLLARE
jgi:hypothetical protein